MWQMIRFETGISASVGGFSLDFGDQCHLFPYGQNIQERSTVWL
jgi:hypothetical protein